MADEIEPALTPGQWEIPRIALGDGWFEHNPDRVWLGRDMTGGVPTVVSRERAHGIAAWCLHGQPFGFTWEDIDFLDDMSSIIPRTEGEADEWGEQFYRLKQRIRALLPPRQP